MIASEQIESQEERIIATAQKLLTEALAQKGQVDCCVITPYCARDQYEAFLKAGHITFYRKTQPNVYTFYLQKQPPGMVERSTRRKGSVQKPKRGGI